MKRLVLFVILLLAACGPSAPTTVEVTRQVTVQVTQEVTRIATVEITREVTRQVPVTVTSTVTPEMSPTPSISPTPSLTPTLTPTESITLLPGYYLVGSEIMPGLWRSDARRDNDTCYWEATSRTGDLLANDLGPAGLTMYVRSSWFAVKLDPDCGVWTYMGE